MRQRSGGAEVVVAQASALLLLMAGACSQDHDVLARRDRGEPAQAGAAGVSLGGGAGEGGTNDAGGAAGSASRPPPEPAGADVLTLMHGVVDAPRLHFCLTRVDGVERRPSLGTPQPEGGLPFGGALSLASLPGLDPRSDDFVVTIVAAEPSEIDGLSCDEAIARAAELAALQPALDAPVEEVGTAGGGGTQGGGGAGGAGEWSEVSGAAGRSLPGAGGDVGLAGAGGRGGDAPGGAGGEGPAPIPPAAVRVHDLVIVPAGTLTRGRSTLLVARGCLGGGTTLNADIEEQICGTGYRPTRPTVAPVFAALSRIAEVDRVGLQVVHAASFESVDDTLTVDLRAEGVDSWAVAEAVSPGSIAPSRPLFSPLASFGPEPDAALIDLYSGRSNVPAHTQSWGDARRSVGAVVSGATYALVVLGPGLRLVDGTGGWNPLTVSIVETTAQ